MSTSSEQASITLLVLVDDRFDLHVVRYDNKDDEANRQRIHDARLAIAHSMCNEVLDHHHTDCWLVPE